MVRDRVRQVRAHGFTLVELIVVVAMIGILAVVGFPHFLSYLRSAEVRAAGEEMVVGLNQARQLAITLNQNICVEVSANKFRYRQSSCTGTSWTGPGTDTLGWMKLQNNVGVTYNQSPVFTRLGAASPGATLTVTTINGRTASVVVSVAGRIQIQ